MDWWKLFSGTFVLIFLAELGDKTQLAAMARTADSPDSPMAKWIVFIGASLALATSTFIAVFLGHILKRIVPDERYIRVAAGALFLIFGFLILFEAYQSFYGTEKVPATASAPGAAASVAASTGFAGGLALRAAIDFEARSAERYRNAAQHANPELKTLLLELATEEDNHLRRLRGLPPDECRDNIWDSAISNNTRISARTLAHNDAVTLDALIQQEEASASFYANLAKRTLIPSVRSALNKLASDESSHASRLRSLAGFAPVSGSTEA